MKTELFSYRLPVELIAQTPISQRDRSRLMVVDRRTRGISDCCFADLPGLLARGDCLVVNRSRVFPGRLAAKKETGGSIELLLLERQSEGIWKTLHRGARLGRGTRMEVGGLRAEVQEVLGGGAIVVAFSEEHGTAAADEKIFASGSMPLPPYIKRELDDPERYQTVYGDRSISSAAPTAGLHFTGGLISRIEGGGVSVAGLELAVGLDTFRPVRAEEVEDHRMHSEWYSVGSECAEAVNSASGSGRIVAVGTTSVRALETVSTRDGVVRPGSSYTSLFITPGYRFKVVDALITNFHFPRSTLLMLVCAFGGRELILEAYRRAVEKSYRFYSFGDAMMVI
jgi:S-adenosylmethionine:tRNA ribosyltransferase-isomerase